MLRVFFILLLSCVTLRASSPQMYFPTTNQLVAFKIPIGSTNRLTAWVSGMSTTNTIDGGQFVYNPTSTATMDVYNVFKPTADDGRWIRNSISLESVPTWRGKHTFTQSPPRFTFSNDGDTAWESYVTGDSVASIYMTGNGSFFWGTGIATVDAALVRLSPGVLEATEVISAVTGFRINNDANDGEFLVGNGVNFQPRIIASADIQNLVANWAAQQTFEIGNVDFRNTAAYSTTPSTLLKGSLKYTAGGSYSTVAQMVMGKENATDGNNAGFWSVQTRPNGGSPTTRMSISSAGVINLPALTVSRVLSIDGSGNLAVLDAPSVDGYILSSTIAGVKSWVSPAGGGTVTSVGASGPSGLLAWSAAVTTSGTLTATLSDQVANRVFAGPSAGGADDPTFRALVAADIGTIAPTSVNGQTFGVGTDYQFTGTMAQVAYGTTSCTTSIADGTYRVTAIVQLGPVGTTSTDNVQLQLYNSTDSAVVANSTRLGACIANSYAQIVLENIITVSGTKTIQVYGMALGGLGVFEPWSISTNSSISKIKLSN